MEGFTARIQTCSHTNYAPCRLPAEGNKVKRPKLAAILMLCLLFLVLPETSYARDSAGQAQPADTLLLELVAEGLVRPVDVTTPSGDRSRLFIVEKPGRIRIVRDGALLATPFLDITGIVGDGGNEQGLLGLTFHPRYAINGYFYVNYTDESGDTVVAGYSVSADSDQADPDSATVLLTVDQPYPNHNGGQLQFATDGILYIGLGDGGSGGDPQNRAQNTALLLGKMLRIDVDSGSPYGIPPNNPFVGPGNPLDEIWSLGLRNPWRFSFDRLTGDMWIGDVGQTAWEEVDLEPADSSGSINWGWRCKEGTHDYNMSGDCPALEPTLTPPIHEYSHSNGCAVTGGYVYRGSPNSAYFADYFFADYCVGNSLRTLSREGEDWLPAQHSVQPPPGYTLNKPAAFGQDAIGDLYIADDSQNVTDGHAGEVYRIVLRPATCTAGNHDVNGDGAVDIRDVQLVAADWLRDDYIPDYDVNCSGEVDLSDIIAMGEAWGSQF